MKKLSLAIIFLLLSLLICNFAFSGNIDNDLKSFMQEDATQKLKKDGDAWNTWKEGLRKEYSAELIKLSFKLEFVNQEQDENYVLVSVNLKIIAFVIDRASLKKRVVSDRVITTLFDRKSREPIGSQTEMEPKEVLNGWNDGVEI